MSKSPRILVTNDDGIGAKGLSALVEAVQGLGELVVVAPGQPQSGTGHAITIHEPLRLRRSQRYTDLSAWVCSGTPVDCVKLAIYEIMKGRPDLVVSGINHGSNAGTNVLYSGTMSAAVEGAIEGIPSIGFSLLDHSADADFSASIEVARRITEAVLKNGLSTGACLNVNIPRGKAAELNGIKICRQGRAFWEDSFDKRKDPSGGDYFWLTGDFIETDKGEDTDMWALEHKYVSIVPTQFDMTAHHLISNLNQWVI